MFWHKHKSECEKIQEMFSPYLDDKLEAVQQDMVKYHVELCGTCQRQLESLRITRELLHCVPFVPVPRSFVLAEFPARRSWISLDIPAIPSIDLMRIAAAAAVIAFAIVVSLDFSGIFSQQESSEAPEIASLHPEIEEVTPAELPLPEATLTPGEEGGIPEAPLPEPGSDPNTGIAVQVIPETDENTEAVDHNGESGVYSPTPRSKTPLWLFPLEIAVGSLVLILGSANLLIWRRKRANR